MDSMCSIGFGVRLHSLTSSSPPAFSDAFDTVQENIVLRFFGPMFKWRVERALRTRTEGKIARALPTLNDFLADIVRMRKQNWQEYVDAKDLLSLFITGAMKAKEKEKEKEKQSNGSERSRDRSASAAAHDDSSATAAAATSAAATTDNHSSEDLSDTELRDIICNFMLAGRDTTAAALSWLFHVLSARENAAVLAEAVKEIDEVFGYSSVAASRPQTEEELVAANAAALEGIDDAHLKRLVYLEAVILETLRLHPPVPADNKVSVAACTLPDGTRLPPNHLVAYSPYTLGRLPTIWGDDCLTFKPERFISTDEEGRRTLIQPSPYVYPVFNAGFRLCLGRAMALLEGKNAHMYEQNGEPVRCAHCTVCVSANCRLLALNCLHVTAALDLRSENFDSRHSSSFSSH